MAASDETNPVDAPPRKLARLLLQKAGQSPPVAVEDLLRTYADLKRVALPFAGDAIVKRSLQERPVVYLDEYQPKVRQRFTIGHELGHLVIPWQPGTLVCHTDGNFQFDDDLVQTFEKEANLFAGELLMPSPWIRENLDRKKPLAKQVQRLADTAEVSIYVAMLAVPLVCSESPIQLLLVDGDDVEMSTRTDRSSVPLDNVKVLDDALDRFAAAGATHTKQAISGFKTLHAFEFPLPEPFLRPRKESKEILNAIVADLDVRGPDRLRLIGQVNGIVGSANDMRTLGTTSREAILSLLRRRFSGRLVEVTEHKRFEEFLRAKAAELHDKKKAR